jgi:hypothetical protein
MQATTWNEIYAACAAALNVEPQIVHVPTDTLVRVKPDLTGNLLGDKAWPSVFDCSRIRAVVGEYTCPTTLADGLSAAAVHLKRRLQDFAPDANFHGMLDRIAAAQQALTT